MSRLSDLIHSVAESEIDAETGITNIPRAVSTARPMLDEDDCEVLIVEALGKRIKDAATKGKKAAERVSSAQIELFPDLRPGHAIDVDGRTVMQTISMSEAQFARLISVRRKQISDDTAYLKVLEEAFLTARPIWKANPDWTFGQVCEFLRRRRGAA